MSIQTIAIETENAIGSYLSFHLGQETFAVNVTRVREILEVPHITKVPRSPAYMCGVINLRGTVLPVVDMRMSFGLSATVCTVNTCIVVLNVSIGDQYLVLGAMVDSVQEVLLITDDQIKPSPSLGSGYQSTFVKGMIKADDHFVMLVDIDKVFSADELSAVKQSSE